MQNAYFSDLVIEFLLRTWHHDLHFYLYHLILCLLLDELFLYSL